jgi:hypothetical protein
MLVSRPDFGEGVIGVTEKEWPAATDPQPMLEFLRGKTSDRKLRLFAVACCYTVWHLLGEQESRAAVVAGEAFADGLLPESDLSAIREAAWVARLRVLHRNDEQQEGIVYEMNAGLDMAAHAAVSAATPEAIKAALGCRSRALSALTSAKWVDLAITSPLQNLDDSESREREKLARIDEQQRQVRLVHHFFGNPFRPVSLDPAWLTANVNQLAETIYQKRRFADLPFLADALADAGCANEDILNHCRKPGIHVRGCWALDLILGRE